MHFYSKHCSLFVAFETVQFNLRVNVESLACRAGIKLSVVKRRFETLSTNSKRPREEKKKAALVARPAKAPLAKSAILICTYPNA